MGIFDGESFDGFVEFVVDLAYEFKLLLLLIKVLLSWLVEIMKLLSLN